MLSDCQCNGVYFSAKLPEVCPSVYKNLIAVLDRYGVTHYFLPGTNDIWCRDYMPLQDRNDLFLPFDYHPDYLMDTERHRSTITDGASVCKQLGFQCKSGLSNITLDGGNVVSCGNKVILTMKILEENPRIPARQLLNRLSEALCAEPVLLPWDPKEIFGHADGICRYVGNGTVLMTNYAEFDPKMASRFRQALVGVFKVKELRYGVDKPFKYNWAYINWLQTKQVIIIPSFGCTEDEMALEQISRAYPEYEGRIEMVRAEELVRLGGGFNCISWTVKMHDHVDESLIRTAKKAGNEKLESAIFPCYGVKCFYDDARSVKEYLYPDGMSDPFPDIGD